MDRWDQKHHCTPKLLDIDPHGVIAHFNWEAIEHLLAGQHIPAIDDVVVPSGPGAGYALAVELTLGDRSQA